MKPKTLFIVVGTLVLLALIAAIANAFKKNRANSSSDTGSGSGGSSSGGSSSTSSGSSTVKLDESKKLGIGSKGNEVKALQLLYNNKYPSRTPLVVDGDFGSKTLTAVIFVMGIGTLSTTLGAFRSKIEGTTVSPETKSFLESIGLKF